VRRTLISLGCYGIWAAAAAFLALSLYQVHVTLVYIGLRLVENPSTRPVGWNTMTITGLSRFVILVLGGVWLVAVSFMERYLREGAQGGDFRARVIRLLLITGAIYGVSYAVLLAL
jgi:hypothetical protein